MTPGSDDGWSGRLARALLVLAVLVACGIAIVWEHARAVSAGYRLHALEVEREKLREERRRLELRRAREERLDTLEERARRAGLAVPGDRTREETHRERL